MNPSVDVRAAVDRFLGRVPGRRLNCAQAVASLFERAAVFSDDEIRHFAGCAGGRAPAGQCGSVYAAIKALEKVDPGSVEHLKAAFIARTGSLACREIRAAGTISCAECVENAAAFVAAVFGRMRSGGES